MEHHVSQPRTWKVRPLRRIGAAFDMHALSVEHLRRLLSLVAVGHFELEAGNICDNASADMVNTFTVIEQGVGAFVAIAIVLYVLRASVQSVLPSRVLHASPSG